MLTISPDTEQQQVGGVCLCVCGVGVVSVVEFWLLIILHK